MELTSRMKMARFETFWIWMRKNKPSDESCKTGQTLLNNIDIILASNCFPTLKISFLKQAHF
ncbi:hypothetical protein Hanom_Chr12g01108661 [Helianthus anomalus]